MSTDDVLPAAPRPSATVVLVRGAEAFPEILMVERRPGEAFGETYTFPGGVLDADEADARSYCAGISETDANTALSLESGAFDFYSAAVRELFEETGVLLARNGAGDWALADHPRRESFRRDLDAGELAWVELLETHELTIACDALHYFAFWETPLALPRRWAARFFLAELPPGCDASHDGRELTSSRWMTASAVLDTERAGGMALPFPTRTNLQRMAGLDSVDALVGWARGQAAAGVSRTRPVILEGSGERRFVIPGDPDYSEASDE